ncbi:MAG: LON peptidase substrate-binding domain-containing protein, partial [Gemmatimonadales bacterium]
MSGGDGIPVRGAWVGDAPPAGSSAPGSTAPSAPAEAAGPRRPRLSAEVPARLPVLPLAQVVVFPHVVVPVLIASEAVIEAVDRVVESHKRVLLGVVKLAAGSDHPPGVLEDVPPEMLHEVATLGTVARLLKIGDGTLRL